MLLLLYLVVSALLLAALAFALLKGHRPRTRARHGHPDSVQCQLCGERHSVMRCVTHDLRLCVTCIFRHDDVSVCVWVPDSRKRAAAAHS